MRGIPLAITLVALAAATAFSWAQDGTRTVFTIDRRQGLVRAIALPEVTTGLPHALTFR
jgi:hypothetical protein